MFKILKNKAVHLQAAFVVGFLTSATQAHAQIGAGHDFSDIARNITESVEELPGMVTAISYMIGLLMGVLGVMKLKDHVENPSQTPLKDGAIRLAAGGALFALPMVFESMLNTIGTTGVSIEPASLNRAKFNVN
ncbi:MAG: hypothetical protein H6860_05285 [Rhodospirillales bacterium]|nr:hypothetical protein [Alphaproteobacteria bacterium]MCB9981795.1 hypothetical protein [Rhodospirillales bacterium]